MHFICSLLIECQLTYVALISAAKKVLSRLVFVICQFSFETAFFSKKHKKKLTYCIIWASQVAQTIKNLPAMRETQVRFLGWEDPLEKGMATQYSCLENSMDRGAWWAIVHGVERVRHD